MSTNNSKQAAWIAVGSLFSMAFSMVSSMILSRYFDKIEYGTYKQVLFIYTSLLAVFTLGLPKAFSYFLPRSPLDEAKSIIQKITRLFFILGGILSIILFLGSDILAKFFNNDALGHALKIFSPVPFLMMPTMGLEGILATYQKTKVVALYNVVTRTVMLLCVTLPVLLFDLTCNEALIGFTIGSIFTCILALYLKYYPIKSQPNNPTNCSYKEIFGLTMPLFVASIWGVLINSTDQFLISKFFGTETFAVFSNGALELPFVSMIVGACTTVLTPLFTKCIHENKDIHSTIMPVWNSAFNKSAMLIYPVIIFCIIDAELIMTVLYGKIYSGSGTYFQLKLVTYFVRIMAFYSILMALGATRFYAKVYIYGFFCLAFVEYLVVYIIGSPFVIVGVHSVFTIIYCLIFMFYIANRLKVAFVSLIPLKNIVKILLCAIASSIVTKLMCEILYKGADDIVILLIDSLIFCMMHLFLSSMFRINYLSIIKPLKA